jgi:excisionase family DNA binding protein
VEELLKKILLEALKEIVPTNEDVTPVNEVMTTKQLAEYLQVSESYIYQNVKQIPHIKLGGTKFRKVDIDKWLENQVITSSNPKPMNKSVGKKSVYQVV